MSEAQKTTWQTISDEIEVSGQQLMDQINRLLAEGNIRKLQIRSEAGEVYLVVPLTAGAVAGGVMVIAAPWLAIIAAIAGLFAKLKIFVVRNETPVTDAESPAGKEASGNVVVKDKAE